MGNLIKNYPISIVFKTIGFKESNGELRVRGSGFAKRLFFVNGNLEYASSDLPLERLGGILLGRGILTPEKMRGVDAKLEENRSERIGRILVKNGFMTQKELYQCLVAQSKMIAANTFNQEEGEWEFCKGAPAIPGNQRFAIPLPEVIVEGVKKISSFAFYKSLLSHYPLHAGKMDHSLTHWLSPFDLQFYRGFLPHSGQMAENIREKLGFPLETYWREVVLFYLLNVFDFNEAAPFLSSETDTLIIHSGILFSKAKPMAKSSKPSNGYEYREIDLSSSPVVEPMETSFTSVSPSADFEMENLPDYRSEIWQKQARSAYRQAQQLYQEKKFTEAATLLSPLVKLDVSPTTHVFLLGLCQAKLPKLKHQAEIHFRNVVQREPWNPEPHYALGELFRSEGMMQLAGASFRRALEIDQDHTKAGRGIREIAVQQKKKTGFPFMRKK